MKKQAVETELKKLKRKLERMKEDYALLIKQQKELKQMAEKAGSDLAKVKQELIRYKDKYGETL